MQDDNQNGRPKLEPLDLANLQVLALTVERERMAIRAAEQALANAQLTHQIAVERLERYLGELGPQYNVEPGVGIDFNTGVFKAADEQHQDREQHHDQHPGRRSHPRGSSEAGPESAQDSAPPPASRQTQRPAKKQVRSLKSYLTKTDSSGGLTG